MKKSRAGAKSACSWDFGIVNGATEGIKAKKTPDLIPNVDFESKGCINLEKAIEPRMDTDLYR